MELTWARFLGSFVLSVHALFAGFLAPVLCLVNVERLYTSNEMHSRLLGKTWVYVNVAWILRVAFILGKLLLFSAIFSFGMWAASGDTTNGECPGDIGAPCVQLTVSEDAVYAQGISDSMLFAMPIMLSLFFCAIAVAVLQKEGAVRDRSLSRIFAALFSVSGVFMAEWTLSMDEAMGRVLRMSHASICSVFSTGGALYVAAICLVLASLLFFASGNVRAAVGLMGVAGTPISLRKKLLEGIVVYVLHTAFALIFFTGVYQDLEKVGRAVATALYIAFCVVVVLNQGEPDTPTSGLSHALEVGTMVAIFLSLLVATVCGRGEDDAPADPGVQQQLTVLQLRDRANDLALELQATTDAIAEVEHRDTKTGADEEAERTEETQGDISAGSPSHPRK